MSGRYECPQCGEYSIDDDDVVMSDCKRAELWGAIVDLVDEAAFITSVESFNAKYARVRQLLGLPAVDAVAPSGLPE